MKNLGHLCKGLVKHGLQASTPVAIIEKGSTPEQRMVIGTVETIENIAKEAKIESPALIIVGTVVELHEKLQWALSPKPLLNKTTEGRELTTNM